MTPSLKALLDAIGKHEAPKGYGQIYGGAKGVPKNTDVSKMTLAGVQDLQRRMLAAGSKSTACGRYQFIRKTLAATINSMGLNGSERWDAALQDRMAIFLMEARGLSKFVIGSISREAFANSLAREWASLPVVSVIRGANRILEPGQSYYAGDGLNKAFHKPEAILALLDAIKRPVQPVPHIPAPMAPRVVPSQPTATAVNIFPAPEPPVTWWQWLFNRASTSNLKGNTFMESGKEIAVVSTPGWSKINWAAGIAFLAALAAVFGLDISQETQDTILKVISFGLPVVVGILRTWFTNKSPSVG